jgi:hypothetical protein
MTTTDSTTQTTHIVDAYLAGYCEPDASRRAALVAEAWSTDGELLDPPFEATGHEGIAALTDGVLAHFPGHTFRRTTAIDAHHTFARYNWELVAADGTVAVSGTDVVEFAVDGRIARVVGFFGDLV